MKRKKHQPDVEKYQPTVRERAAIGRQIARRETKTPLPRLKVLRDGTATEISLDHPNQTVASALLREALGTADNDFVEGLIRQIADTDGTPDEGKLNFMLAVIKDTKPNDQLEAMLAAQMAAVHVTFMKFAQHFHRVETLAQQDSAERAFNKLARTFTTQMEALKRYRTGGEQKVTVQHVSVGEGGQAIVGNVTQATPQAASKQASDTPPALTDARQPAMPIIDKPVREPVAARGQKKDEEE